MKKLIIILICGFLLALLSAWGQKWIEPYADKDGTQVEGHCQTLEDVRKEQYSTPGKSIPIPANSTLTTKEFPVHLLNLIRMPQVLTPFQVPVPIRILIIKGVSDWPVFFKAPRSQVDCSENYYLKKSLPGHSSSCFDTRIMN